MSTDSRGIQPVIKTLLALKLKTVEDQKSRRDSGGFIAKGSDEQADRLVRELLVEYHGTEIDKADGFMTVFDRPIDAITFSFHLHQHLLLISKDQGVQVSASIGIHLGEIYLRENRKEYVERGAKPVEIDGLAKPTVARLTGLSLSHQTLITRGAFDVARRASVDKPLKELRWVYHGPYLFKGMEDPIEVFEVGEPGVSPLRAPDDAPKATKVVGDNTIEGWRPGAGQAIPDRPNWVITKKLGEGGFGEVWLATHNKTKALLVFKFCFEKERLRGLQREVTLFRLLRDALGNRKDITRILDWNFEKAPYYIQAEYTQGGNLDDWVQSNGGFSAIGLNQRLELLTQTASALAAAHSVGILHKDLKPFNILVDCDSNGKIQAKLTDFGIGLITDEADIKGSGITVLGFSKTLFDEDSYQKGTQVYMAPELLEGKPATVQADIYALGILYYQMMIGDFRKPLAPGWERHIEDPFIKEDIAVCVDGSPQRRLGSASELVQRIQSLGERRRHHQELEFRRIEIERAKKELVKSQRRKKLFSVAALLFALFSIMMWVQSRRIAREADRANREAGTAAEVSEFLVDLFKVENLKGTSGESVTARALLDESAKNIEHQLGDRPEIRARMMESIGRAYMNLGLYDSASPMLEKSFEIRQLEKSEDLLDLASSLDALGMLHTFKGEYALAEKQLQKALSLKEKKFGKDSPVLLKTLENLIQLYQEQGLFAQAYPLVQRQKALHPVTENANPKTSGSVLTQPVLTLERRVSLPQGGTPVGSMAHSQNALVRGGGGYYVVDLTGSKPITPVLLENASLLEVFPNGTLALLRGGTVVYQQNQNNQETSRIIVENIKPGDQVCLSSKGDRLAVINRNNLQVYSISHEQVDSILSMGLKFSPDTPVSLTTHFIAWADEEIHGEGVHVVSLDTGKEIFKAKDWEGRVFALGLNDTTRQLAVGGWFDEVYLYDLETNNAASMQNLPMPGKKNHPLLFLPDGSLCAGADGGVFVWHPSRPILKYVNQNESFKLVEFSSSGLLVEELTFSQLFCFDLTTMPFLKKIEVTSTPIWTVCASGQDENIFVGTADGLLLRYAPGEDRLESRSVHTLGITDIVARGGFLITGSDDKSLIVWDEENFKVVEKTKAHQYLINALYWDQSSSLLWTASSDATLKGWSFPDLKQVETIQPGKGSNASLWVDSGRGRAFVGKWGGDWVDLQLEGGKWRLNHIERTKCRGIYSVKCLEDLNCIFMLGVDPSRLWVLDLGTSLFEEIPLPEMTFTQMIVFGKKSLLLMGEKAVSIVSFEQNSEQLSFHVSVGFNGQFKELMAASLTLDARLLACAGEAGILFLVDPATLPKASVYGGPLFLKKTLDE